MITNAPPIPGYLLAKQLMGYLAVRSRIDNSRLRLRETRPTWLRRRPRATLGFAIPAEEMAELLGYANEI